MQTQKKTVKDSCPQKLKAKKIKPICAKVRESLEQKDKKKELRSINKISLGSGKKLQPLAIIPLTPQKKRKKRLTSVKSRVLTTIKKATIPSLVPNF